MTSAADDYLTVAEIASILKLNPQTVRNWIDAGTLPALHVGRRVRVPRAEFDALLERSRTAAPSATGLSQARDFWDGELVPAPALEPGEGDDVALRGT